MTPDQIADAEAFDGAVHLRRIIAAQAARIEALEAGLKPFAAEADEWWAELPDSYVPGTVEAGVVYPGIAGGDAKYTIGDLRRAANLLGDRHE